MTCVASQQSGCLPAAPGASVSGSLISVMSGALDPEHQVKGDPETIAGSSSLYRSTSQRSGPWVSKMESCLFAQPWAVKV